MAKELRFDDRVVIVTGAGNGLGRSHALSFASRGAKVVVNDLGGGRHGEGKGSEAADKVVQEIQAAGGKAVANYDSVENGDAIVKSALDAFGRVDVVINNAGILRDTTFHKMTEQDWELIYRVHVLGAFRVTHAAWPHMREQGYGRVIMTASAAGIYGNFGQTNYSMAKLGLLGMSNTLALEGRGKGIHVNTIAPIAGSRLTETVMPKEVTDALAPEVVSPLVLWLANEECQENGGLFEVGGGYFGKLRWERAKGSLFRVGRKVTPEMVQASWKPITDFTDAEHPSTIGEAMAPVFDNLKKGPSKGGNEFLDVDAAMEFEFPPTKTTYDERDVAIYALGVGEAQGNPFDQGALSHVYELSGAGFRTLPTYGVVQASNILMDLGKRGIRPPGMNYGLDRILHGEQYLELKRPLPTKGTLTHKARVTDIFDKGKGAVIWTEVTSLDEDGDTIAVNRFGTFVRGAGGFGGERGPSGDENTAPDRKPDAVVEEKIAESQALVYRLSGDWNPLHADPAFAKAFGFDKPILHGLCTLGFASRHVLSKFAPDGNYDFFKSIKVRFAESVFPGETLVTEMWKESPTRIVFRTKVKERDKVVLSSSAIELFTEIPKKQAKPKAAAAPAAGASADASVTVADVFAVMSDYVKGNPDTQKVGKVFQFKVTDPDEIWTVDLKDGGGVAPGETKKPDCVFELSNANFLAMVKGEAQAQKLYFGGQLKIHGDVMASQKLDFLAKLSKDDMKKKAAVRGGATGGPAAAPVTAAPVVLVADVFGGMGKYVAEHAETQKVGKIFQFKITDPDEVWTLDLKEGAGVQPGETKKPDCTFEMSNANFLAMVKGEADAQKLYFKGELKIAGDIMASQKLDFLGKIPPSDVEAAMKKRLAGDSSKKSPLAGPAASAAPKKEAIAAKLEAALAKKLDAEPGAFGKGDAVVAVRVTEPDHAFTIELKGGKAKVASGAKDGATTVVTLKDGVLAALARGEKNAQSLYQHGEMRVDGDVGPAHRFDLIRGLSS